MRKKQKIYKIIISIIIFVFIFQNFNFSVITTYNKQTEVQNQKIYHKYNRNNSNDYYGNMENFFDHDPDSNQFNIYLKFKRNPQTKIRLGPIGAKSPKPYYLIVEYTRIFGSKKFCEQKISDEQISMIKDQEVKSKLIAEKSSDIQYDLLDKCKFKNCFFSCDKDLAQQSDILLFHDGDLRRQVDSIPENHIYQKVHSELFNFNRDPSQIWLLWNDEANNLNNKLDNFHFNWTLSYNSMADISFCTYGCLTKTDAPLSEISFGNLVKMEFEKRASTTLWFVSNCGAKARMDFVEKLSLYHHIEIHGKCVGFIQKTFKNTSLIEFKNEKCPRDSDCEKEAFARNKFYLAFENQNCSDYVTEKFWRSLDFNLIPIVLHPNKEYYERIAPKNSFIHLSDFGFDEEKLSTYLNMLSNDLGLYSRFFEWKKIFKVEYKAKNVDQLRLCELCERINNLQNNFYSYYDKVSNFFNNQCTRK